ncbi:hypothetical protein POTOM_059489 [Populus tomentosa]|uniref:Endonuclease/exonuclease/phosphatase domain-containing protein n=1 Tax=Populus tomentosa TaxID=118781 RepID=A0A8X7XW73_POPTO|nr:hypothetical protein POTOM_059489 [Populus tomentosa]
MVQYDSTEEDTKWLYRSLVGNILPNVDVATLEATILKSVVNTVSFRFLGASQGWGFIAGYNTTCVSQGSISGIRVLIRTIKMEPLHDKVSLKLDEIQGKVLLNKIKGDFIPSLTTVKHSMDVSLCTESVISDDEEDETKTISVATIPRATRQNTEFEFICTLGYQDQNDNIFPNTGISALYLHPEIVDFYSHATLSEELVYEDGNHLALVLYDYAEVATADSREIDEQQVMCMLDRDGLDQQKVSNSGVMKKMGQGKSRSPSKWTNNRVIIVNRRSQRNKAKKLSRKAPTVKRRKPRKMGHQSSKKAELGIIDYSVSDNGIRNRNVIIRSGKEIDGEDEVSSSHSHISLSSSDPAREPLQPDPREEAAACWEVEKVVLQVHDESHLMTQTLQSFIEKEQEEWVRRKKQYSRDRYAVPSLGRSGGILCIWNPVSFCVSNCSVAMNGHILHVEGVFSRFNMECLVSFVYAPNDVSLKKELANFKTSVSKPWCLAGDFNETLSPSNRKGGSRISAAMISFKNCIDCCELVELPLNGKKFTWSRGNAASRIDRLFVSGDWLQSLPSSTLYGLPKNFSDHRPLHMLIDSTNWGPKPFRLMNCWWFISGFRRMIQDYWNSTLTICGKKHMAPALRLLKDRCKEWSKEAMGNTCRKINILEMEAEFLESQKESRDLSSAELTRSEVIYSNLRTLYRIQESAWHQKSRVQWCKLGDRNTRFFHLSATTRHKKNQIFSLDVDGMTLTKPSDVKIVVFDFFKSDIASLGVSFDELAFARSGFLRVNATSVLVLLLLR